MASKRTPEAVSSRSSSSSHRHPWNYDVFLSFRGKDTRKNFTDHLYHALKDAGISTYRDDSDLPRGEDISIELLNAIQVSRISLIVFSRNYAASRWCLDELVKIMECRETVRQVVLPIFYDVNPSDVRKQTGSFREAFVKLEERLMADMDKVSRWRDALTKAGALSGWDLTSTKDRFEATVIKDIVEEILNRFNNAHLNVAKYPVGIDSRVQDMNELLRVELNDVRIIGICATGGMGKTTVAKAVFNQLCRSFQDKSFLANVRETSKQPNGQVHLQEQLLFDILKMKEIKVSNVDRGINVIKERLCNRRVLVVLDDVDQSGQLNAIAGKRDWFGLGSRIIITTRDKHLLDEIEADDIYMLDGLNCFESLALFSWHAFKKSYPKDGYIELSNEIISYCKGLPLALEVLGSSLFGRSEPEWKSQLEKLKRIPPSDIQEKLRISYDASEDNEKEIFLDIACFFIGVDKDYAIKILHGCGLSAEIGISLIIERCLLNINEKNELTMHDLLRDMGREIVRKESPNEPENRSRLWFYHDVLDILTKHTGTKAIEGLILKLPTANKVCVSTKALAKMHKLRLLQLDYVQQIAGNDHLFKELRWLCWHGFPKGLIPSSFHLENLVVIDMQYSKLRQVWKSIKVLEKLKFLDLSHSYYLTETPDFSQLPNLEKLILEDCTSLVKVHPSIGHLGQLVLVNVRDCKHLKNLPRSICRLKSLEILNVSGCSKIRELPEDLGEMEALIELLADNTAIRQVPSSIGRLKNLKELSLFGCKGSPSSSLASACRPWVSPRKSFEYSIGLLLPPSLLGLRSLRILCLNDCNLSDEAIPEDLGSLSSLITLDLGSNNFRSLPASIRNLHQLELLLLNHCRRLRSFPELPINLRALYASGCISLKTLSNLSKFPFMPEMPFFREICMVGCNNLSNVSKESLLQPSINSQGKSFGTLVFPGNEIPKWFSHQWTGPSSSFRRPASLRRDIKGLILCAIYGSNINATESRIFTPSIGLSANKLSITISTRPAPYDAAIAPQDHIWAEYSYLGQPDHTTGWSFPGDGMEEFEIELIREGGELHVKKFGVHLIYDDDDDDDAARSIQSGSEELRRCFSASRQYTVVSGPSGLGFAPVGETNWSIQ